VSAPGLLTGLDAGTLARLRALSEQANPLESAWAPLALGAKYAPWGNALYHVGVQYRVVGKTLELRGLVNPLAGVVGTDIVATLPTGARPAKYRLVPVASATVGMVLQIASDGTLSFANGVAPVAGSWISFDGTRISL
jgi:hypothetical protein